ncbi:hypothetical protein [Hymenobacter arizonensis]|uniref:Outer membrane protein beta-barrel domain-containing protein n=1 Tax=Hymenobacter arizonensis TaxID=1227077 RepID=A0A1I6ARM6_HYMAR|nr:hypothetical protein [Hymenobacter arizonensis]SFQ71266.1 hypothetical protein SAMN04515668_3810 [Hymenobacter arizonensis]
MKRVFRLLVAAASVAALPLFGAQAQTTRKPTPKRTARPASTAPKPAAKPTSTPAPPARPTTPPEPAAEAEPSLLETVLPTTFAGGPFVAGDQVLNFGIGVGSRSNYESKAIGGSPSASPALSLSYERGLLTIGPGVLGAGILAGYQRASYALGNGGNWKYTDVLVALRGAFHYPVLPEFDAYGGLGVGLLYTRASFEGSIASPDAGNSVKLRPGIFVGGRYFLLENLGVFTELGYDQTYLKVGITGKF